MSRKNKVNIGDITIDLNDNYTGKEVFNLLEQAYTTFHSSGYHEGYQEGHSKGSKEYDELKDILKRMLNLDEN